MLAGGGSGKKRKEKCYKTDTECQAVGEKQNSTEMWVNGRATHTLTERERERGLRRTPTVTPISICTHLNILENHKSSLSDNTRLV